MIKAWLDRLRGRAPQPAMPPAGQAAVETLPPELLARIQGIHLRVRHLVSAALAGEYTSHFKGRGVEFEEVRAYQPGDDVRTIDWNVTARLGAPFVKEYREERELTVLLVVDVSGSSAFGSSDKFKHEVAAEVAAVLAYTAIHSNDRVGLLTFSSQVEQYIPAKKGRAHVWRVIRAILNHPQRRGATDLDAALDYLGRVLRRRAVVFLISDFLGERMGEAVQRFARRHEVVAVAIGDPREQRLEPVGFVELEDAETSARLVLDSDSRELRRAYERAARRRWQELSGLLASMDIDLLTLSTGEPYLDQIARYFRQTARAGRRGAYGHGPSFAPERQAG